MKRSKWLLAVSFAGVAALMLGTAVSALTGIQIGPSGATYSSAQFECALNPITGMGPMVRAGLYNPKKNTSGKVSLNGTAVASVTFLSPDATVWLANGANTVDVSLDKKKAADTYSFDASTTDLNQPNICIPDTSGNSVIGDLEYAASNKSYVTIAPGCALNGLTGRVQPFVNLVDNGAYLLDVSINRMALTQLDGVTHTHTPVFLSAGLNVISAVNGSLSTDYFVRDGGTGSCTLP